MKEENIEIKQSEYTNIATVDNPKNPNSSIKYSCVPNNIDVLDVVKTNWNNDNTPDTYRIKCIIEYMLQS
jgi:hypothetical protein